MAFLDPEFLRALAYEILVALAPAMTLPSCLLQQFCNLSVRLEIECGACPESLCQFKFSIMELLLEYLTSPVKLVLVYVHSLVLYVRIHVGRRNPVGPVVVFHSILGEEFIGVTSVKFTHVGQKIPVYPECDYGIHHCVLPEYGFRNGQVVVYRRSAPAHLLLVHVQRMFIPPEFRVKECQGLK